MQIALASAVESFADRTHALSDAQLEQDWEWKGYDEGVRFAFFRVYETLRQLAADLTAERATVGPMVTAAQRALATYHAAYRDLEAITSGLSDEQADLVPAEGEWSLREALEHMIQATRGFYGVLTWTLQEARAGKPEPSEMTEAAWEALWAGDTFRETIGSARFAALRAYHEAVHARVLRDLVSITEEEKRLPSMYWESELFPVQFRLHRFDSHLRQHTIQVEKTLEAVIGRPSEARRLLRLIYAALAEIEGICLGAPELGIEKLKRAAEEVQALGGEVGRALGSNDRSPDGE
ncbi:MAG TPA: DinB family protein [Anaerolineales bacterium]|nr:DinB family protein [Anaerolineales bacterium]